MASVTIGTAAGVLIQANPQRIGMVIVNTGSDSVYIGNNSSVTSNDGFPLKQDESFTYDSGGDKLYLGDFYGITASGTSDVRVHEFTR